MMQRALAMFASAAAAYAGANMRHGNRKPSVIQVGENANCASDTMCKDFGLITVCTRNTNGLDAQLPSTEFAPQGRLNSLHCCAETVSCCVQLYSTCLGETRTRFSMANL